MSEVLTGALDPAAEKMDLTPRFAGVFLLALVGNAAELINAVRFARKDKMDLAIGITVGASTQVALLVAPVLVFAGYLMGRGYEPPRLRRTRCGRSSWRCTSRGT